ncbi:MAG: TIGR04150 pseudo-rSAM protein, partial [Phocaeicola sp.]
VNKIYVDENLGSIELESSDLADPETHDFVDKVVMKGMGELLNQNTHPIKPVILLPILSLNLDVEKFKDKENVDLFLARDISKYLLDVNIVLNNSCQLQCRHCPNYCKQFFCCSKGCTSESLSQDSLVNLLRQISYFPVRTINITGGNIYHYQYLDVFKTSNKDDKKAFNFYVHYLNYQENPYIDNQKIHLIVNTPVNTDKLHKVYSITKEKDIKYHLVVENEEQYDELESALTELGIEDFEVHPYYNGRNIQFFEDNVFLSKEDIVASTISMREIFRNQKLNANSFGSLYILPNGDIKANLNEETIGHLGKDRIIDVINHEMMQNTAWRKVRSSEPCQNCVYQYLCPPLSNYERVLHRQNLCHVLK